MESLVKSLQTLSKSKLWEKFNLARGERPQTLKWATATKDTIIRALLELAGGAEADGGAETKTDGGAETKTDGGAETKTEGDGGAEAVKPPLPARVASATVSRQRSTKNERVQAKISKLETKVAELMREIQVLRMQLK